MLSIPCPWCGPRHEDEFTYGGGATVRRPEPGAPSAAWLAYVYLRDNPRGPHVEYWQHTLGCRAWFKVVRDTLTHEITASAPADRPLEAGNG